MRSIADTLAAARDSGIERIDAEVLLCHVLDRDRTFLFTWPEKLLTGAEQQRFDQLLMQRAQGMPVAHLTGEREFWSLPLKVNATTLIPRPDTEILVQAALDIALPAQARVLDAGTGSGAIALALASERRSWQVVASDRLYDAALLARHNARQLHISNADVVCAHWLDAFATASFDMIVSNPPYIAADDPHLAEGDVRFEPRSALVAADNGLADLLTLVVQARRVLKHDGWLLLEHGYAQAAAVRALLSQHAYTDIDSQRDFGGHERVTRGRCV